MAMRSAWECGLALGAQRGMVLQMILRQAAVLVLVGIGLGIAGTVASSSMLQAFLYGTVQTHELVPGRFGEASEGIREQEVSHSASLVRLRPTVL